MKCLETFPMVASVDALKILMENRGALRKGCVYIAKGICQCDKEHSHPSVAITYASGSRCHKWRHADDNGHPILSVIKMPACHAARSNVILRTNKK